MKEAYERLRFYQNICKLRYFTYKLSRELTNTHLRLASQMDDAARSAKQNIREGYKKGSAAEFANSIRISRGSLGELAGDYQDCFKFGLISSEKFKYADNLIKEILYQTSRYLFSLYKMETVGMWKNPYGNRRSRRNSVAKQQAKGRSNSEAK